MEKHTKWEKGKSNKGFYRGENCPNTVEKQMIKKAKPLGHLLQTTWAPSPSPTKETVQTRGAFTQKKGGIHSRIGGSFKGDGTLACRESANDLGRRRRRKKVGTGMGGG